MIVCLLFVSKTVNFGLLGKELDVFLLIRAICSLQPGSQSLQVVNYCAFCRD